MEDEIEYVLKILKGFAEKARKTQWEKVSLEKLCIGLKCGGSDGYSGLTANPLDGGEEAFRFVAATANSEYKVKSETFREIAFYKTGVTLQNFM